MSRGVIACRDSMWTPRRLADAGGGRYVGATPDDRDVDA